MFSRKTAKPAPKAADGRVPPLFARSATPRHEGHVVDGPGQPLDTATRNTFETRFGHDFSSVRVHADERAAESAASLSARAYTLGRDVVFGRGEYAPETSAGRHLIGHELAHVVQQSRGGPDAPGVDEAGLEAAADYAATQASAGAAVRVGGRSGVRIARKTIWEEFTDGKYVWNILRNSLEYGRPVASIISDINGLSGAERDQAITDLIRERRERARTQGTRTGQQRLQTEPELKAVFDPMLEYGKGILDRIDAVIEGLSPGALRAIPGWNFTPEDYARLQGEKKGLTMSPDSAWFPEKLQENLSNTLAFVLGSTASPPPTEGINALDLFHGHLVVKKGKDSATNKKVRKSFAASQKFEKDLARARTKEIGEVNGGRKGSHMTEKSIGAYGKVLEKAEPALATIMSKALTIPGAAVMYHTFEFNNPLDLKVKGQKLTPKDPRRHYVTPLDTNTPEQYTPPPEKDKNYFDEYTHLIRFSFLVDDKGAIHVRPFTVSGGGTSLELSTITGTAFQEPLENEWLEP